MPKGGRSMLKDFKEFAIKVQIKAKQLAVAPKAELQLQELTKEMFK